MGAVESQLAGGIQMEPFLVVFLSGITLVIAGPVPTIEDDILKSEIEAAAEESRALADDLAEMLASLDEEKDQIEKNNNFDVNENKVETELRQLVKRIRELAVVSAQSNELDIHPTIKEKELKTTLEQLELVAVKVEEVSSFHEVDTFEEMAQLLQSISNSIERKVGKSSIKHETNDQGIELSSNTIEFDGIDEMIRSIEKVADGLKVMNHRKIIENKIKRFPSERSFALRIRR